jgi:hypothetical protein
VARRAAGIIKAIADRISSLRQGLKSIPEERVAILYNDASSFTVSTMESAEKCVLACLRL